MRVFRNDKQTGRIHIETIDKADFEALTRIFHIFHKTVCNGVIRVSLCRMNDNAGLLVYNQKIVVFVNDSYGNILGRKIAAFLRKLYRQHIAFCGSDMAADFLSV